MLVLKIVWLQTEWLAFCRILWRLNVRENEVISILVFPHLALSKVCVAHMKFVLSKIVIHGNREPLCLGTGLNSVPQRVSGHLHICKMGKSIFALPPTCLKVVLSIQMGRMQPIHGHS